MSPLQRPATLTETVARHIRDAIVRGEFAPGTALPEVRLADELGTSRGTVREALRTLEDQGLVDVMPHKGSFVSRVTKRKARELYELRGVLEAYAVRLAVEADAFDGQAGDVLREMLRDFEMTARRGDPMETIAAERALHRQIWSGSDNELLHELMKTLALQTRRLLLYNKVFRGSPDEEIATHRELVEAVLTGDPARAEDAVRDHIAQSAQRVLSQMPEDDEADAIADLVIDEVAAGATR
ncbi:MAG TPA: GntR family transcriptional regulator [Candidatus Limnocylindrales bacterium]|nr:GntR family transcriptional regulator [Candidatus Limnocylindrales bacterium]